MAGSGWETIWQEFSRNFNFSKLFKFFEFFELFINYIQFQFYIFFELFMKYIQFNLLYDNLYNLISC